MRIVVTDKTGAASYFVPFGISYILCNLNFFIDFAVFAAVSGLKHLTRGLVRVLE